MARFVPGSASQPSSEVELTISCRNLLDTDVFSKSDPMCVTYLKTYEIPDWQEISRTEMISNTLNPDFVKKVQLSYKFEEQQLLKFAVYDVDTASPSLQEQDFLGFCECTLGQIVSAGKLTMPLQGMTYNKGELIVSVEELAACRDEVTLQFCGRGLDRKDWFGQSDPFLEFYKVGEDGDYRLVHRTEVIKWTLNPTWNPFTLPIRTLCNGDMHRSIKVMCHDWNRSGNHSLIGEFYVTLQELSVGPGDDTVYLLIHPSKKQRKGAAYKHSGQIRLLRYEYKKVYSFLDYIMGGTQLNCTIAIDFTGVVRSLVMSTRMTEQLSSEGTLSNLSTSTRTNHSSFSVGSPRPIITGFRSTSGVNIKTFTDLRSTSNGDPQAPNSLHYIHSHVPNQYEQALTAVGEIIQDYDSDKLFPVLGFGARLPPDGRVSHEFFVNMHPDNPYCNGITGVLEAYRSCIRQIQLYGPTNFSPIINHVAKFAQAYQDGSQYFILLIITDGVITDMVQTKQAIIRASSLPMSIIIVGVGTADFEAMNELDADTVPLSHNGVQAVRDIVQFVPFRNFQRLNDVNQAKAFLAKEVLMEIPDQIVWYMKNRNITPKHPVSHNIGDAPPPPYIPT